MPRFLFDVLNSTGRHWENEPVECSDRDEVEAYAHSILIGERQNHNGGIHPIIVVVLDSSFQQILIATDKPEGLDFRWIKSLP